jgi:hypothetical protein
LEVTVSGKRICLAVLTGVCAAVLLTVIVGASPPVAAAGTTESCVATAAKSTRSIKGTATTVDRQMKRLNRAVARVGATRHIRTKALRTNNRVVRLNRSLIKLNRTVLAGEYPTTTIDRLVILNKKVARLDTKAAGLLSRARVANRHRVSRKVTTLRTRVIAHTRLLRDKKQRPAKPKPSPSPTVSPTPTPAPTPEPTPTETPMPEPTPTETPTPEPTPTETPTPEPTPSETPTPEPTPSETPTPDPTPTETPTPEPTPTETPTPEPTPTETPTPEPTPSETPTPEPTPVYEAPTTPPATTSTITDLTLSSGQSNLVYENVRFASSRSYQRATVTITRADNITFKNCVFDGSAWNGITINDSGGTVSNITFINSYVKGSERMGFECTSRNSTTRSYSKVDLLGMTFEPQGSEAISYDSNAVVDVDVTVKNVVIRGSGTRPDLFDWGQGFEINGPKGFLIDGLTMYRTRGSNFNLSGRGVPTDWTFKNVVIDNTKDYLGGVTRSSLANLICADLVYNSLWLDSTFTNALPGGCAAWIEASCYNDFRGITWNGSPTNILEEYGSTGNLF